MKRMEVLTNRKPVLTFFLILHLVLRNSTFLEQNLDEALHNETYSSITNTDAHFLILS